MMVFASASVIPRIHVSRFIATTLGDRLEVPMQRSKSCPMNLDHNPDPNPDHNLGHSFIALLARLPCNVAAALAVVLISAGAASTEPVYSFETTPGRLPKSVVPTHYAIALEPNLDSLALAGSEIVDLDVREPTTQLTLNAVGMT